MDNENNLDIDINLEVLFFVNKKLLSSSVEFEILRNVIKNFDLNVNDSKIINLLNEVKSSVDLICNSYTAINDRVCEIKAIFEEKDKDAALLFSYLDGELSEFLHDYTENSFDYICDIYALLNVYSSGELVKLKSENSPYNMYFYDLFTVIKDEYGKILFNGEQYITDLYNLVQKKYKGREAAVNSALLILKLAADRGVKYDYQHKGTYTNQVEVLLKDVISGVDCNAFVSWVVASGCDDEFHWQGCEGFNDRYDCFDSGPVIDYSSAKPGDIFVNNKNSGSGAHIGVIIANDSERGVFIVAEARSDSVGIILGERTYAELETEGYNVRDMEKFYE